MQWEYDEEIEKYVTQVDVDTDEGVENRVSVSNTPADVLAQIRAWDDFYRGNTGNRLYTFVE